MPSNAGRPRILHRKLIIEIPEDTQEFLHEVLNKLIAARIAGKGLEAAGEAVRGAVSHPIGFLAVSAAITALLVGYFGGGEKKEEELSNLLKEAYGIPGEFTEPWFQAYNAARALFPFLPGIPSVGVPPVTPPTEKERLCSQLAKELELAQGNLLSEPGQADFWEKAIADIIERQAKAGC